MKKAKSSPALARLLKKHRLERHAGFVEENLEPSVRIDVGKAVARALPVGTSKFGGLPDLPDGVAWPVSHESKRPLQFLAQIDLADVPREAIESAALPDAGRLFFWVDGLLDWELTNTRLTPPEPFEYPHGFVTYAPAKASLARTAYPEFAEPKIPAAKKVRGYSRPDFGPYTEHRVGFRSVLSMNRDAMHSLFNRADDMANADAESDEWDRALAFVEELHGGRPGKRSPEHRLLGAIYEPMGEDMREAAQRFYSRRPGVRSSGELTARNRKSWILLAKFASDSAIHRRPDDAGWLWSDCGSLCFWLRDADVAKRDFSKTVAVIGNSG